jgi:hypothetical protein
MKSQFSILGIISFVVGLLTVIGLFGLLVLAGILSLASDGEIDENSPVALILGLVLIGSIIPSLIGIVCGVVGLFETNKNRVFAILGIALSSLGILALIGLMVLGAMMG